MLEIQEKFDTAGYEELVAAANGRKLYITEAMDGGRAVGFIAYSYEGDHTVVYDYSDMGDLMLCDGLVRSVMFKSVLKGIETMVFEIADESKFGNLKKLRFLIGDGNVCEDLNSFMNACESCKNKNTSSKNID